MALMRPCLEPGCPAVATERGRCAEHAAPAEAERRRTHDARRGSSTARGYGYRWQKLRAMVLRREPRCRDCSAAGRVTLAEQVHHIDGNSRHNALENLMPLCASCHSRRTNAENRGR